MDTLQNLLLLYGGVVVVNLAIAVLQWRASGGSMHRRLLEFWMALLAAMFVQALAGYNALTITSGFGFVFFIYLTLAGVVAEVLEAEVSWLGPTIALGVGWLLSVLLFTLDAPFALVATPVTLAVVSPMALALWPARARWSGLSVSEKSLVVAACLMLLHGLDFPLMRDRPGLAAAGYTIGILVVLALAILGPTCAAERIGRKRQEDLEELTDALAASNRQLEQFAFATSHGLREPLRHLVAYSDMLEEALPDEPSGDGARILARIRAAGRRLETLVDYLIMYTHSARLEPERGEVPLNEVLGEVRAELSDVCHAAEAHFEVEALPVVSGDREMLTALLKNLIANALRFRGPRPALIQVSAADEGDHWQVAVHDQGIGIPTHYVEQVFEPFFRLHVATDGGGGGGVGLAVCKRIVEAHGGSLSVKSKVNTGSSFTFTLPKSEAA